MSKKPKQMLVQDWISSASGIKESVLKLRSVNNIVIAPAKTGNDNNKRKAVIKTDQTNKGIR